MSATPHALLQHPKKNYDELPFNVKGMVFPYRTYFNAKWDEIDNEINLLFEFDEHGALAFESNDFVALPGQYAKATLSTGHRVIMLHSIAGTLAMYEVDQVLKGVPKEIEPSEAWRFTFYKLHAPKILWTTAFLPLSDENKSTLETFIKIFGFTKPEKEGDLWNEANLAIRLERLIDHLDTWLSAS